MAERQTHNLEVSGSIPLSAISVYLKPLVMSKIFRYLPQVIDFVTALEAILAGYPGQTVVLRPSVKGVKLGITISRA